MKSIIEFEYNSIMIMINKFIKKMYFVLFHKKIKTEKMIYLFKWHIIVNHKILMKIISDKNMQFRLKFWQTLTILKKMKTKISTIKHSQINDQIKKLNQIMK